MRVRSAHCKTTNCTVPLSPNMSRRTISTLFAHTLTKMATMLPLRLLQSVLHGPLLAVLTSHQSNTCANTNTTPPKFSTRCLKRRAYNFGNTATWLQVSRTSMLVIGVRKTKISALIRMVKTVSLTSPLSVKDHSQSAPSKAPTSKTSAKSTWMTLAKISKAFAPKMAP